MYGPSNRRKVQNQEGGKYGFKNSGKLSSDCFSFPVAIRSRVTVDRDNGEEMLEI